VSTLRVFDGTLVRSTVSFRDIEGVLADPPTVVVKWMNDAGTVFVYTYITDVEVVRDAVGIYHMDRVADSNGAWWVQWEGVGLVKEEDYFYVQAPHIP